MRLTASIAAVAMLAAPPASAADRAEIEARYSRDYTACMDRGLSTAGMIDCISTELGQHDQRLNAQYRTLMIDLNPRQQGKLREAQRAWIAWRDKWCAAQQDNDWGSLSTIIANQCMLDMTIERVIQLEHYPPMT